MKPHLIERFKVDSSNIASVGYDQGLLVIEFAGGNLYAYPMSQEDFERFALAESKGKYFAANIRGKVAGTKLTGACPKCGSAPEIIGETCSSCGCCKAVAIEKRFGDGR